MKYYNQLMLRRSEGVPSGHTCAAPIVLSKAKYPTNRQHPDRSNGIRSVRESTGKMKPREEPQSLSFFIISVVEYPSTIGLMTTRPPFAITSFAPTICSMV